MKKAIAFLLMFFILSNIALCQLQIEWQQCYGGTDLDEAKDIIQVDDGYIVIGHTYSNDGHISSNHGDLDGWLIKIDNTGALIWEKCYGGSLEDGLNRIFSDGANNYVLVGGAASEDGDVLHDPYPNSVDYWVVKVDTSGNIVSERIVGSTGWEICFNGINTNDAGVIAMGMTYGPANGDVSVHYGYFDGWMIKLDDELATDWDFSIGTTYIESIETTIQTSDGGYLVGASSRPEGAGNINCVPYNYMAEAILFKLDSNINEEWQQCYGGSGDELVSEIFELENGYIFCGVGDSDDGDLAGSGWHGEDDIWIVKTDLVGNIIWQKCYGGSQTDDPVKFFQTEDDGFIVFCNTYSYDGDVIGNLSNPDYPSIWVFKINNTGVLLWQQCIGSHAAERVYGVIQESDYNYSVVGSMTYSPSGDVNCSNFVYGSGDNYWVFGLTDTTVNVIETNSGIINVNIYPNPVNSVLHIDFPNNYDTKNTKIEIVDINGKSILKSKAVSSSTQLDIEKIQNGLYLVKIQNDRIFITKRIIIQ